MTSRTFTTGMRVGVKYSKPKYMADVIDRPDKRIRERNKELTVSTGGAGRPFYARVDQWVGNLFNRL